MAIINGDNGSNRLIGTSESDRIDGLKKNDFIDGQAGDDLIYGGTGDDTLVGGDGIDRVYGELGNDNITGGEGNDYLYADNYDDRAAGNDFLSGGNGDDALYTFDGNDIVEGGAGNNDSMNVNYSKSEGNITYTSFDLASGSGALSDGAGNSVTFSGIEKFFLTGGSGNDELLGGNLNDELTGNSGNDTLIGGAGDDFINGYTFLVSSVSDGEDLDIFTGGAGADKFILGQKNINYLGTGHATITDFSLEQGDKINLYSSADLYNLQLGSFGGSGSIQDTAIYSGTDLVGVVHDANLIGTNAFIYS